MGKRMPIKVIITGATGMVGEGVLNACLKSAEVESVLVVTRRATGVRHPKLKELIHHNFFDFSPIASELDGYDACYFCLGVTSLRKTEKAYFKLTHTLTLQFAKTLCLVNQNMTFCYVSGKGTDNTETGRIMWARVKGKTENDLNRLPFAKVFSFRPGFIKPTAGNQHTQPFYKYVTWLFPLGRKFFPGSFCKLEELSQAMLSTASNPEKRGIYEVGDIQKSAMETIT
ncbi:NAD-dependent epimerase/dehydratase family protein [Arachidicoccus terrestris]|uniref:NAD-dependent epimerase/dehydratase family protein n=1 Tax=Arachidicoccus terrestris TaxID=2875539 RepID=UPI001CC5CB28|nr:NAD-dependent epimerase/dehydratase family protein [Arachidicoccus terrestris]